MANSMNEPELPSLAVDPIALTPLIDRTAASTRCVIWVSISVGAAPGCAICTITTGNSISGCCWISMRMKLTIPAITSPAKNTSGITGLRIDHAEMFLRSTAGP